MRGSVDWLEIFETDAIASNMLVTAAEARFPDGAFVYPRKHFAQNFWQSRGFRDKIPNGVLFRYHLCEAHGFGRSRIETSSIFVAVTVFLARRGLI